MVSERVRSWFVAYFQYWLYTRQLTAKQWLDLYGKATMARMLETYDYYHCYGEEVMIEELTAQYLPSR